jgi:hypothetical protein
MIPGWTREKLNRLIEKVREVWTPPKDNGFWENLYCLGPGQHEIISNYMDIAVKVLNMPSAIRGPEEADDIFKKSRKVLSQKLAYYGKKHGKKYAVRRVPGGVKIWRIE